MPPSLHLHHINHRPHFLAASAFMLLTLLVFPVLMKNKIYLQLVFVATACDLIATSWVSIGYPTTPFACTGQAMFTQFFLYAEWCWTYFIAHKLYCTLTFVNWTNQNFESVL